MKLIFSMHPCCHWIIKLWRFGIGEFQSCQLGSRVPKTAYTKVLSCVKKNKQKMSAQMLKNVHSSSRPSVGNFK